MRVVVVGGGIGGMAAAVALQRVGQEPLVLERAEELREVGAGINLSPNGIKALDHLGCADVLESLGTRSDGVVLHSWESGEPILFAKEEAHFQLHRADLLGRLRAELPDECVRLGSRVVGFSQGDGGVAVTLDGGDTLECDVIVGADGINSTIREALVGAQEARFTGCVAWRAVFPADRLPQYAVERNWGWAGRGRSAFFFPIRRYELHNFVANVPAEEVLRESWTLSGDVEDLRRSMAGSCEQLEEVVGAVDEAFLTGLYFRDPLESWGTGRATLLGDAAHPAGPFMGQGGAMALEDAITLASCLRHAEPSAVPRALKEYEARRRPRTTRFQIAVRANQEVLHERDPDRARARVRRARGVHRLDPGWAGGTGFLIRFDPVAALERPADELAGGAPLRRREARDAFDLWRAALSAEDEARDWPGQRAGYERFIERVCPTSGDFHVERTDLDGVPALTVAPPGDRTGPLVFHLHGGGYVIGSAASSAGLAARLAGAVDGTAVTIDYRLAPEHGCPAALDDAVRAYLELRRRHSGNQAIVVTGEDAGGGLAIALTVALRDRGAPLPAAIYLISPLCDLTLSSPSIDANSRLEPWWNRDLLTLFAGSYLQEVDPASPTASPVRASLAGLPPLLIHAAKEEALSDDATRIAARAEQHDVDVMLRLFDDTVHSFPLFDFLPEARGALEEFRSFSARCLAGAQSTVASGDAA